MDEQPFAVGDRLHIDDPATALRAGSEITVVNDTRQTTIATRHRLSPRQVEMVIAGGRIPARV